MTKPTTATSTGKIAVATCAFVHQRDVDPDLRVNVGPMNELMEEAVNRAAAALREPAGSFNEFQSLQIRSLLTAMRWSHRGVRQVLGKKGPELPIAVDGLSMARMPLEGLFSICLMLEGPEWVDGYMRYGWAQQYRRFLLQREETRLLPRFTEFSTVSGPQNLEELRKILGVSEAQRATVEYEEVGVPLPAGLRPDPIRPFPTPRKAVDRIPAGPKRAMLVRLYPEYQWLCSFVHVASESAFYKLAADPDARLPFQFGPENDDLFHRRVREPAYILSLLSLVQATAEIGALYPHDVGLAATVTKAWQEMSTGTLLGRAIWEVRTKSLLGIIG